MANGKDSKEQTRWIARYGTLESVTERVGKNGPFISFKLLCEGFDQYGACWDEDVIKQMKAAIGQYVWMRGPLDPYMRPGPNGTKIPGKSFKVVDFRLSKFDKAPTEDAAQAA